LSNLVSWQWNRQGFKITQLSNQQRTKPAADCRTVKSKESGDHEGSGIGKKDLRQMQDRAPQGRGAGDLRKREAQTAAGLKTAGIAKIGSFENRE
jgi:hypothetical protein